MNINSVKPVNTNALVAKQKITNQKSPIVLKWNESEVEEWIRMKKIDISILDDLRPCDGRILNQLYKILTTAPEFFYCALTAKNKISLRDVAVFTSELESLFKD